MSILIFMTVSLRLISEEFSHASPYNRFGIGKLSDKSGQLLYHTKYSNPDRLLGSAFLHVFIIVAAAVFAIAAILSAFVTTAILIAAAFFSEAG